MTIPPVAAPVPADVRAAGAKAVERYQSAQGFERLLVDRLTQSMLQGTPLADGPYADTVATALGDGIAKGGGLGLSEELYRSMSTQETTS